ncbi:MAG: PAS domain-containing protein [Candidatus Zixiibacteriota bacterium]|nr:MAG: PAS domain-containing protein [candidate division Zixibacteria bacterium]
MKDSSKTKKRLIEEIESLRRRISRLESEKSKLSLLLERNQLVSDDMTQQYLDVVHTMIVKLDSSGKITQINKRGCEILGYEEQEIIGKNWFDKFLPKYFGPEVKKVFKELMAGDLKAHRFFENPVITKDGEERLIAWHNIILKDLSGKINGTLSSGLDITADFYASEALKESEEKYQMLFDKMIDGFALHEIICDNEDEPIDYRFLEVNPSFEKMTGLLRKDVIGKTVKQVLPGIESFWIETYGKVALTGKSVRFENYSQDLDRYYDVVAFCPEKGQFGAIFIDITDRKKTEKGNRKNR